MLTVAHLIYLQLWNDIKTDDLENVNKILLRNLRKMANESPVVKVKIRQKRFNMKNELDFPLLTTNHYLFPTQYLRGAGKISPRDQKLCCAIKYAGGASLLCWKGPAYRLHCKRSGVDDRPRVRRGLPNAMRT